MATLSCRWSAVVGLAGPSRPRARSTLAVETRTSTADTLRVSRATVSDVWTHAHGVREAVVAHGVRRLVTGLARVTLILLCVRPC